MILEERLTKQAIETFNENDCVEGDTINPFNKTVNKSCISPTITAESNGICKIEPKIMVENIEQTVRVRKYKVEHWFRTDSSFSIPDENVWFDLKKLLKIQTNEYDKQIMEFEIKNNVYEKSNRCYSSEGISPTLTAADNNIKTKIGYRIRKLTPRECWRLMSFTDDDFEKAEKVNSNTQLYKQAGNSIVVKVLEAIFLQLI